MQEIDTRKISLTAIYVYNMDLTKFEIEPPESQYHLHNNLDKFYGVYSVQKYIYIYIYGERSVRV